MGRPKKSDDYSDKSPATSNTLYSLRSRCIIKPQPRPPSVSNNQKKKKEKEKENLFHPTSAPQPPQSSQENSKPFPSSLFPPPPSPPSSPGLTWQPRSQEESEDIIRKQLAKFMSKFLTEDDYEDNHKINYMEWTSWANKALDYYNLKQGTKFKLVRVTGVVSRFSMPRRLVHIEFEAKSDDDADDDLCKVFFSEMLVPWDEELETVVHGCCTMEKTDSGEDLNAPACSHCGQFKLRHPTPRYGFRSNSGDSFADLASYY